MDICFYNTGTFFPGGNIRGVFGGSIKYLSIQEWLIELLPVRHVVGPELLLLPVVVGLSLLHLPVGRNSNDPDRGRNPNQRMSVIRFVCHLR
jgi:hypothetical protein